MNKIQSLKKQARAAAKANGSSHQTELNAIAQSHGHDSWGRYQQTLHNEILLPEDFNPNFQTFSLEHLIDAYEAARQANGHLVVLRPTEQEEEDDIGKLWDYQEDHDDKRLEGLAFTSFMDLVGMECADGHGQTLIAGSGSMPRDTDRGYFIVQHPKDKLRQINSLYSKRDQKIIYATRAVKHLKPTADQPTISITS